MEAFSQKSKALTIMISKTGYKFVAKRLQPNIPPSRIKKKIVSIIPRSTLIKAKGRKINIAIPYDTARPPRAK